MDLEAYYNTARMGANGKEEMIFQYIGAFKQIIIWGSSGLGVTIGKYIEKHNIHITDYWDIRADEIEKANGAIVNKPFTKQYDTETSLLIICVTNMHVRTHIRNQIKENGYRNVLLGQYLYQSQLCPASVENGINFGKMCFHNENCPNLCNCERLINIVHSMNVPRDSTNPLTIGNLVLTVNQKCNLSCKHCITYMPSYNKEQRVNFSLQQIIRDIDRFTAVVDSIAAVIVMGGEPFMHPEIDRIVQHLKQKENIGYIDIASNGVYPIQRTVLERMRGDNVIITLNNYLPALPEQFEPIFKENIRAINEAGIDYTVGNYMHAWRIPSTLYKVNYSEEDLMKKGEGCRRSNRGLVMKNGKIFPCEMAHTLYHLGIADYSDSYLDITAGSSLREKIFAWQSRPYYEACKHCRGVIGEPQKAALQGRIDYTTPPDSPSQLLCHIPG